MRDVLDGSMTKEEWQKLPSTTKLVIEDYESKRSRLSEQQKELDLKVRKLDNALYNEIVQTALESNNELVRSYAEALLHQQCGVKPKTKSLGYAIADIPVKGLAVKHKRSIALLCCLFDKTSYVFCNTRYDERSGDQFFRRS